MKTFRNIFSNPTIDTNVSVLSHAYVIPSKRDVIGHIRALPTAKAKSADDFVWRLVASQLTTSFPPPDYFREHWYVKEGSEALRD